MKIQTIDSLSLTPYWHGVLPSRASAVQGQRDGACGVYALLNALVLGGHIEAKKLEKVWDTPPAKGTNLWKWQRDCGPLLLHGTTDGDLSKLLLALRPHLTAKKALRLKPIIQDRNFKEQRGQAVSKATLHSIASCLRDNKPLLLELQGPDIAHWVVAVGIQEHKRDEQYELAQILTIDSSEPVSRLHAWNGALGFGYQGEMRLRYATTSDDDAVKCGVDCAWVLEV
jgi:hypothetical protein